METGLLLTSTAWDLDSRIANMNNGDSAKVRWNLDVEQSGLYNVFIQFSEIDNLVDTIKIEFYRSDQIEDTILFTSTGGFNQWNYAATIDLDNTQNNYLEMSCKNFNETVRTIAMDVIKLTGYIRDRRLITDKEFLNAGETSIEDTLQFNIELGNIGIYDLTVSEVYSINGNIDPLTSLPLIISGMGKVSLPLSFLPDQLGVAIQTSIIDN